MDGNQQYIAVKEAAEKAVSEAMQRLGFYQQQAKEAADVVGKEILTMQSLALETGELKKEVIGNIRGLRMTATTEIAAVIKPLEDLRKFFLGAEHDKEVERLREFVDLCERLEKLKKSGFLDTVADTMLKLS
jgi:phosphoenolpyruvate-protein kinase (PTS system EI component)